MVVENCKFFKESSEEEREHAEKLMKYQNIRGGRVTLHPITGPPSEFAHAEKGDALYGKFPIVIYLDFSLFSD
ncbi:hypothetical protein AHAS_Ahas01G0311200 [Arachis hypogaea]